MYHHADVVLGTVPVPTYLMTKVMYFKTILSDHGLYPTSILIAENITDVLMMLTAISRLLPVSKGKRPPPRSEIARLVSDPHPFDRIRIQHF